MYVYGIHHLFVNMSEEEKARKDEIIKVSQKRTGVESGNRREEIGLIKCRGWKSQKRVRTKKKVK